MWRLFEETGRFCQGCYAEVMMWRLFAAACWQCGVYVELGFVNVVMWRLLRGGWVRGRHMLMYDV